MSFFDEENAPVLYNAVVGLCQALAGGTLLYVTVFEIMDREKVKIAKKCPSNSERLCFAGLVTNSILFC